MPQKTQAELDEEERKKQQSNGIIDWLKGLLPGGGGGFGIGSIFTLLLVVTGVYFVMRNEKVQEFVGGLFGEGGKEKVSGFVDKASGLIEGFLSEDMAEKIGVKGARFRIAERQSDEELTKTITEEMSAAAAQVIVPNRKVFFETIKEANGGTVGKDGFTNDKSIFALLTKQPALVKQLIPALMPAEGTALTDDQKKMKTTVLASLQKIVTDERLAVLLDATNRKNTIAILAAMTPGKTPEQMDKEITALCDKNGAPTAALTTMLSTMLTPGEEGAVAPDATATAKKILNDPNASVEVKKQLANAALADPEKLVGAANVVPFNVLMGGLGEQKAQEFVLIAANEDKTARDTAIKAFVMQKDTLPLFKVFADTANIAALPPEMQKPISDLKTVDKNTLDKISDIAASGVDPMKLNAILNQPTKSGFLFALMNAENRAVLRQAGTDKVAALIAAAKPDQAAVMTKGNLDVILAAADKIGARAGALDAKKSVNGTTTAAPVLNALMELMSGNQKPFADLSPSTVATFFSDPEYAAATEKLVAGISSTAGGDTLLAIKRQWGHNGGMPNATRAADKNGSGLAEVLADEKSVEVLIGLMKGKMPDVGLWDGIMHYHKGAKLTPKEAEENLHYYLHKEDDAPTKMRENAPYIEALAKALSKAGVSLYGSAKAPASTATKSYDVHTTRGGGGF